jgi:SAM-dependent methyltransferase
MTAMGKLWKKAHHRKYKNLVKLNELYLKIGAWRAFGSEMVKRSEGLNMEITPYFFSPHNPISNPKSIEYIAERYQSVFEYVDNEKVESILEVGCGFGLSCWIMSDAAEKVVGLDISSMAVETAKAMFPECQFIEMDVQKYFEENPDVHFSIIINSAGPVPIRKGKRQLFKTILEHCDVYIHQEYRAKSWREFLFWEHKLPGRQLSPTTTACGKGKSGISWNYLKYFFNWRYLDLFRHSMHNKNFPPF